MFENETIAIVGLGYVGLPLAVEFGKNFSTKGFDVNTIRIDELKRSVDSTEELSSTEISEALHLEFTSNMQDLESCKYKIIAVPTPIDTYKTPDLMPLKTVSSQLAKFIRRGDVIIYESTVFPGATEEICVPILEQVSGLIFNKDFFVGYSPERVNPGDQALKLRDIKKLTSGSTDKIASEVNDLYSCIITAGTHKCSSIKVAEAAKIIENTQRDVNIALVNELSIIFSRLDLDTDEVLKAAATKWNFLHFRPGLVGGHCIGVDPFYLTYKAQQVGYHPELILAGRRLNDAMAEYSANKLVKKIFESGFNINNANVLIMGFTFKENCKDIRNTKVADLINELKSFGINVEVSDPLANPKEVEQEYSISLIENLEKKRYQAIVLAVPHNDYINMGENKIRQFGVTNHVFFDLKSVFENKDNALRL